MANGSSDLTPHAAHARIVIIGGGLAGLTAAFALEQRGITDYRLLEARPDWGGRIQSRALRPAAALPVATIDRVDLGPTWFWPDAQPELDQLIGELGLPRFAQFETGDMMVERSPHEAPRRTWGYASEPTSMRLVGGMAALVDALRGRLRGGPLVTGRTVVALQHSEAGVAVLSRDEAGVMHTVHAEQVLLAVPPRLALATLRFWPELPPALGRAWQQTATWMAPHAKYLAVYDMPFWRDQGLSGEARSLRGPLGEIHDASMPGGAAALFGFFALPAAARRTTSEQALLAQCRAQLGRLFGPLAATPRADVIKDWAADPLTATVADLAAVGSHGVAPPATAADGPWHARLVGVGSEWSPQFPGYVAGAVEAARLGVQTWVARAPTP